MGIFFAKNPPLSELISEVSNEVSIWAELIYEEPRYKMVPFQKLFRKPEGEIRTIYGVLQLMYLMEYAKHLPKMNKILSPLKEQCVNDCDRVFVGWNFKRYWNLSERFLRANAEMRRAIEPSYPAGSELDRFVGTLKAMCSFYGALALMGRETELMPDPNLRSISDALFANVNEAESFVFMFFEDNYCTWFSGGFSGVNIYNDKS